MYRLLFSMTSQTYFFHPQQYMYLNQLQWARWAAVDEIRKTETDREVTMRPVTPPSDDAAKAVPVTPKAAGLARLAA